MSIEHASVVIGILFIPLVILAIRTWGLDTKWYYTREKKK